MTTYSSTYFNYLGQPMALSADPGSNYIQASAAGQTITAPTGPSALYAYDSSGHAFNNDTFIGSNGDNTFYINNNTDLVQVAGGLTGVKSIIIWAGGYTLPANVQNLTFYGAGNWGAGNNLDNLIIMGGNDHATLDGGGGNDVLVGGDGENDFQFEVGAGGHDVFYGFHPNLDTVRIAGANFTSFAQVQSAMQQSGSDVVLTIDANDSITFRSMTIAQFTAQNFLLPLDHSQLGPMTFDEEFNSLDFTKWNTTFGGDPTKVDDYAITSNTEKELYVHPGMTGQDGWDLSAYNPFSIEGGGVLDITATKFSYADSQHTWGQSYASGMLNTRGLFMQQYGFFEMRAELPTDLGSWPGFWLSQDPYAPGVEADVLEHLALYPDFDFQRADDAGNVTGHTTYMPALSGFHTYGMLWGPQTTTFYIDDLAVMSLPTPTSWNKPMYMILDMAMGGWGGQIDNTALPAQMKVDYVRVYGLADGSSGGSGGSTGGSGGSTGSTGGSTGGGSPAPPPTPPSDPSSVPYAYGGDGVSAIAFRDPTTGAWGFMTSNPAGGETWHNVGPTSTDYTPVGAGDFNGDGFADIAFRQTSTGEWGFMTANPSGGETWRDVGPSSLDYTAIGVGDFNGDGLADLAFRQASTGAWGFMTANPSGGETWHAVGPTSLSYAAIGVGDFLQDGRAEIAFRNNSTGDLGFMAANPSGGQTWHPVGPTSVDYQAIGVGDFNGDGVIDIAFRQTTTGNWGYMSVQPSGGEVWHAIGPTSTAYAAIETGDFNGDGLSDIAFRNTTTGDLGYMSVNPAGGETWHPMGSTSMDYFSV